MTRCASASSTTWRSRWPAGELADAVRRAVEWRSTIQLSRGALGRHEQEMALGRRERFADSARRGGHRVVAGARRVSSSSCTGQNVAGVSSIRSAWHRRRCWSPRTCTSSDPLLGHIERAALLHDVGKLVIPKAIMRKAWPLSAGEHAIDPIARAGGGGSRGARSVSGADRGDSRRDARALRRQRAIRSGSAAATFRSARA